MCLFVCEQNKERDESFKLELTGTDCEGAKIGRIAKTIVTIMTDEGQTHGLLYSVYVHYSNHLPAVH